MQGFRRTCSSDAKEIENDDDDDEDDKGHQAEALSFSNGCLREASPVKLRLP